ncbi:MAG: MATE family efflux transporter [Coriobacteriales bacterium]|nr:MATE family efflux transporter [Coriobacteriales bacterium]
MAESTTDPKELFGTTPVARLFVHAALPGAVGMLVSSLYDVMDGILVGNFIGETAFAAINLAMPFVIVLFAFGDLIGVGSAVPISIALGENRDDDANSLFTCSCLANIALGTFLGLLLWLLAPTIFRLLGATGELAQSATLYLRVYAAFAPISTIAYAFDNYLRISGRIRRSLVANTFLGVFGAVLEFIFLGIFGMNIGAAALAYSLAIIFSVGIAIWPFFRGELQLKFVRPHFSLAEAWEVFRCGLSTFLDNVAGRITSIVMNTALLAMGGENAVSIYGCAMFAEGFIIPLLYGILDALQPAVGYNWGARDYQRVKRLELLCFGSAACLSVFLVILINAAPGFVVRLFLPQAEEAFMTEAVFALRIFSLGLLLRWFCFATQMFLVSIGDSVSATLIAVCSAIAFPLPLIWLLSPLGLTGLWFNSVVNAVLTAALSVVLLLRLRGKVRVMSAQEQL